MGLDLPSNWWPIGLMEVLLLGMATWRISSLLVAEAGPWNLLERFRYLMGMRYDENSEPYSTTVIADALSCVWCLSVWTGSLVVVLYLLFPTPTLIVSFIFSMSTISIVIERIVDDD